MMATVIQQIQSPLPENTFSQVADGHHLMPLTEALRNIHFPTNLTSSVGHNIFLNLKNCFYVQLNILRYAKRQAEKVSWIHLWKSGRCVQYILYKESSFPTDGCAETGVERDTERCRQWQTDESPFAGRCRKWKKHWLPWWVCCWHWIMAIRLVWWHLPKSWQTSTTKPLRNCFLAWTFVLSYPTRF